jgi:peptidoglycan-binding protein ArfA
MVRALLLSLIGWFLLAQASVAQTPRRLQHGLQAAYYHGTDFDELISRRTDAQIDFTWHQQEPVPGLAPEYFSVRWTGYLFAPVTGDYKFYLTLDDGMRLWVGNKLLFNEWGDHREYTTWVPMHLKAGTFYPLRLEYRQGPLWNRALLAWVRPDMKPAPPSTSNYLGLQKVYTPVPIPAQHLYSDAPPPKPAAPALPVVQPVVLLTAPKAAPALKRLYVNKLRVEKLAPPRRELPKEPVDLGSASRGTVMELQHLYFEQSKARLLPSSLPEMERLALMLHQQPTLRLQIAGHTDNVGDPRSNQLLSQQRAEAVRDYLLRQGIAADRLEAIGYGGTRPASDNAAEPERARNRRVEVTIL